MKKLLLAAITFFPAIASAHEEHGHTLLENLTHVFSNPEHVWPLTIGIVLVVAIGYALKK
mgnify:CR=1 FL=1